MLVVAKIGSSSLTDAAGVIDLGADVRVVKEVVSLRAGGHRVLLVTSGAVAAGVAALRARLLPIATLVTPNLREAEALTGRPVASLDEMREAAVALVGLGARAALVKGGHLRDGERAVDVLYDGEHLREYAAPRVSGRATHGTGCTLSAAITAGLARGRDMAAAIASAKRFVTRAMEAAEPVGRGVRPIHAGRRYAPPGSPACRGTRWARSRHAPGA